MEYTELQQRILPNKGKGFYIAIRERRDGGGEGGDLKKLGRG